MSRSAVTAITRLVVLSLGFCPFSPEYGKDSREGPTWRMSHQKHTSSGNSHRLYKPIAMHPTGKQDEVILESFRIILCQYRCKPEVKSLAPDGTLFIGTAQRLLKRAKIIAGQLIPVGICSVPSNHGLDQSQGLTETRLRAAHIRAKSLGCSAVKSPKAINLGVCGGSV